MSTAAGDRVAFELVELIDKDFAQRAWGSVKLKLKFQQELPNAVKKTETYSEEKSHG